MPWRQCIEQSWLYYAGLLHRIGVIYGGGGGRQKHVGCLTEVILVTVVLKQQEKFKLHASNRWMWSPARIFFSTSSWRPGCTMESSAEWSARIHPWDWGTARSGCCCCEPSRFPRNCCCCTCWCCGPRYPRRRPRRRWSSWTSWGASKARKWWRSIAGSSG